MPDAFRNGEFIPESQLAVSIWDTGFMQGVTVSERLRTFGGRLFRPDLHFERLRRSAEIVGLAAWLDVDALARAAAELADRHHRLLDAGDDVGVSLFVTPGPDASVVPAARNEPTIGIHAYPLPFETWSDKYTVGQRLQVSTIRQVPSHCWPAELKCRSRMHYFLADREARQVDPQARAVLLDLDGYVSEASTANLIAFREAEGFVSPPLEKILPGVSVATLAELSAELGIPFVHRDLTVDDVLSSDEILLSSTSPCLIPVASVNGQPIQGGKPGPCFRRALALWSERVGVDIQAQARRFATRRITG